MTLEIDVLTLFPAMIDGPLAASIPGRIQEQGIATIRTHDLRQWGLGRHRSVDDAPYGGGAGMVMRPEPIAAGIDAVRRADSLRDPARPRGRGVRPGAGPTISPARSHLVLVCARYEGVDERVRSLVDLELSIGDYVLTGGELPALVVIDAVIRLLPGAIDDASTTEESFADGPARIPAVHPAGDVPRHRRARRSSTSGDHGAVARWRAEQARGPDARAPPGPARGPRRGPRGRRLASTRSRRVGDRGASSPRPSPRGLLLLRAGARGRHAILRRRPIGSARLLTPTRSFGLPTNATRNRPVNVLDEIVADQLRTDLPELASGDTVKVSAKVVEGNRERIQVFEGIVMRLRGGGITRSITVRRIASGVGVERTFKIHSPRIEKIEVVRHGQVRRAQLYFLRERVGKAATLRERRTAR